MAELNPAVTHPQYNAASPIWIMCRDAYEGDAAIKARKCDGGLNGTAYLPKLSGQKETAYANYRDRAEWYNAVGRTVTALRGMIFRKPPISIIPEGAADSLEDITQSGISLEQLAKRATDEILTTGRGGILVDYPKGDGAAGATVAAVEAMNRRPFWKYYPAESILNWKMDRIDNKMVLARVALEEEKESVDPENEFGIKVSKQIRMLEINASGNYQQRIYEKDKNKKWILSELIEPKQRGAAMRFIPFAFIGLSESGTDIEKPPLYDLVTTCIAHYRNSADFENGLFVSANPTAWAAGGFNLPDPVPFGTGVCWISSDPAARAGYLEFTGAGLGMIATAMGEKRERMAALGSRVLSPEKRAVETAEVATLHRTGENSILADIAGSISAVIEKCLRWHCEWMGIDGDISYQLNRDFFPVPMSPDDVRATMEAWQSGAIAFTDVIRRFKQGEFIDVNREPDDIQAENDVNPAKAGGGAPSWGGGGL